VSVLALSAPGPRGRLAATGSLAALVVIGAATAAGALGERPAMALVPVALLSVAYLLVKMPVRLATAGFVVLVLVVDSKLESEGQWRTPFSSFGDLLGRQFGLEIIAVLLLGVSMARQVPSSRRPEGTHVPLASALAPFLALYVAGVLLAELMGLARGQPPALWKLRNLLQPVLLVLLFSSAFRGPRDHALLGRIVVASACARALLAVLVQRIAIASTGGRYAYATSHGDSILFSAALFLVVAEAAERPKPRELIRAALLAAVILVGAIENGRRAFWAMVAMTAAVAFFITPARPWKRLLLRYVLIGVPVLALYVGVGWNRGGRIFGPVQTFRGMLDTSTSRSSYWREVENWNIAMSLREAPLTGMGLGGHYTEVMPNDDISMFYPEYRQWPHNAVLGLLLLLGPFGFTAVSGLLGLALYLATRSYRLAEAPGDRVAAFGCIAALIACLVLAWSDLGPGFLQYKFLAALAVTVSARLAVATGAWPAGSRHLA
jgi:O-antigen ligase